MQTMHGMDRDAYESMEMHMPFRLMYVCLCLNILGKILWKLPAVYAYANLFHDRNSSGRCSGRVYARKWRLPLTQKYVHRSKITVFSIIFLVSDRYGKFLVDRGNVSLHVKKPMRIYLCVEHNLKYTKDVVAVTMHAWDGLACTFQDSQIYLQGSDFYSSF